MVEKPCSKCWHKGRWNTCRHPTAELPQGGSYMDRFTMRVPDFSGPRVNPSNCGIQGRLWLKLPPFFILRFKYWLMSRRQKTQWADAVASLMQQPQEDVGVDIPNIGAGYFQGYPHRQAKPHP